jgi:hypothetical protein
MGLRGPQPEKEKSMEAEDWARMWKMADDRYDALCMDIMRVIAEGGDLSEVLFTVARSMDNCDRVDEESTALFERAKARING